MAPEKSLTKSMTFHNDGLPTEDELLNQVSQLRGENSKLLKRLTDVNQRYNDSAVDNRVLKADVETLRAKVKMAEATVKRVFGLNLSEITSMGMPLFDGNPSESSADASVPVQEDPNNHFCQSTSNNLMGCIISSAESVQKNKIGRTNSLPRVASLEHLQKRIHNDANSCGHPNEDK